jgi:Protein of unknown function (DUF3108)
MRLIALLFLVATTGSAGATSSTQLRFDLTLARIRIGELTVRTNEAGYRYEAGAQFATAGLAGLLDYMFEGIASGTIETGAAPSPEFFSATSRSPRALRHTRIDWDEGRPQFVAVDPPRDVAVDPATQVGAVDPVSALAILFHERPASEICATSLLIFDGSRSLRLTLDPPEVRAGEIACTGSYSRIAGEPFTALDPTDFGFEFVYGVRADGQATIDHVRAPTRFGDAVIRRKE